jgi:hypothetical protein
MTEGLEHLEQRVYGVFTAVECTREGITLVVRTANAVLRARAPGFANVEFIAHRPKPPSGVNCGAQAPAFEVYLTWRVPPEAANPTEGTAVAIELLPDGFVP